MPCLNELAAQCHADATNSGWYETEVTFADYLASIHAELSEAWECWRNSSDPSFWDRDMTDKPIGIPIELADCLIRILGMCHDYSIDIDEAVAIKGAYNRTRPPRHGGKRV